MCHKICAIPHIGHNFVGYGRCHNEDSTNRISCWTPHICHTDICRNTYLPYHRSAKAREEKKTYQLGQLRTHIKFLLMAHAMTNACMMQWWCTSVAWAAVASLILAKPRPLLSLSPSPSLGRPDRLRGKEPPAFLRLPPSPPAILHHIFWFLLVFVQMRANR